MREVFNESMDAVYNQLNSPIKVNGDGRFDSPGHSAMFGLYTIMDSQSSKILASSLVKVSIEIIFLVSCQGNIKVWLSSYYVMHTSEF